jgi:hypothetical protein
MLASISNAEVSAFGCGLSFRNRVPVNSPEYVTFFQLIEPGDNAAGLALLWLKENGNWKITAFHLDEP